MTTINLFIEKDLCDSQTRQILELMEEQEREPDRDRHYEIKARIECAMSGYRFVRCIPPPENERTAVCCALHEQEEPLYVSGKPMRFFRSHYLHIT